MACYAAIGKKRDGELAGRIFNHRITFSAIIPDQTEFISMTKQ
jgi:hypothetical protein